MRITKKQLNQLIEGYLTEGYLTEHFQPDTDDKTNKVFYPVVYEQHSGSKLEGTFIAGDTKNLYYIALDEDEVKNLEDKGKLALSSNINDVMKKIKANGNEGKIRKDKVLKLIDQGRLLKTIRARDLTKPQAIGEDKLALFTGFMKETGIATGAAVAGIGAAAAAVSGLAPLAVALEAIGNTFNVADFFVQLDSKPPNYLGAIFCALGLVPGGDTIGVLNRLGKLDDVFPAGLSDDLAREIIKLFEGDTANTLTELVNAYAEDRKISQASIAPFITKTMNGLEEAGRELAASFQKIKQKGNISLATT
jgi:hypothetical protein